LGAWEWGWVDCTGVTCICCSPPQRRLM